MHLIIVRHAKSSWDNPYLDDHSRPLSNRGKRASVTVGNWLAAQGHIPASVISSTSKRTKQTWNRIQRCLPEPVVDVRYLSSLYHAGSRSILSALQSMQQSPVLVLGHNPGIGQFAADILENSPSNFEFWKFSYCRNSSVRYTN